MSMRPLRGAHLPNARNPRDLVPRNPSVYFNWLTVATFSLTRREITPEKM